MKASLSSLCKDARLKTLIEEAGGIYTQVAVLSSRFILFHMLRLSKHGVAILAFDTTNSAFVKSAKGYVPTSKLKRSALIVK